MEIHTQLKDLWTNWQLGRKLVPYKSDKQRKFMHAVHPVIATRWDREMRDKREKHKSPIASAMERRGK